MWQHTIAQMVAEELDASMYIHVIKEIPTTGEKYYPQHTAGGAEAVGALLPKELFWDSLPVGHPHRMLCADKNISYLARPKDYHRRAASAGAVKSLKDSIRQFVSDEKGEYCMVMLGYFQRAPPDLRTAQAMWAGFRHVPLKRSPDPLDIGVYIRCTSHYPKPSKCSLFCFYTCFLLTSVYASALF
jgi:hypothetical protein